MVVITLISRKLVSLIPMQMPGLLVRSLGAVVMKSPFACVDSINVCMLFILYSAAS